MITEILVYSSCKRPSCDGILDSKFLNSLPLAVHWADLPITVKTGNKGKFLNRLPYENEEHAVVSDIDIENFSDIDEFIDFL